MYDIVIIGAGIIGSMLAYDLAKYDCSVLVVDREHDVANEVTMANSAIVHAGYDPKENTLKAKLNKRGAMRYPAICEELHVHYNAIGAFVVANNEEEEKTLQKLLKQAQDRQIKARMLSKEEVWEKEPNASKQITMALEVPDTAIVYPWEVAHACMESALMNGAKLWLDTNVTAIEKQDCFYVHTSQGVISTKMVINAAGCGSEQVMNMFEPEPLFHLQYKRGEYYVLSKQAKDFVKHILYPAPSKVGKGVLALPTVHGNILLGPTSETIETYDTSVTRDGLAQIQEKLAKVVDHVPYQEIIRTYSGIRPTGNNNDFYIEASKKDVGMIHLGCIDSPGLASAPAISEYVIETFIQPQMCLRHKKEIQQRKKPVVMAELSHMEKQEMIQKNAKYGKIICRCECISEQEIVDAIHSTIPATSIKAIKKRVRPGMGKCQGGFCEVEVAKILARELHCSLTDVLFDAKPCGFLKSK